jgi:uncharacterized protein with PIN domain
MTWQSMDGYPDTSSLLKLIWPEEDSEAVAARVSRDEAVLVSSLTELESAVQTRPSARPVLPGSFAPASKGAGWIA